jgi:hypothetical protein
VDRFESKVEDFELALLPESFEPDVLLPPDFWDLRLARLLLLDVESEKL